MFAHTKLQLVRYRYQTVPQRELHQCQARARILGATTSKRIPTLHQGARSQPRFQPTPRMARICQMVDNAKNMACRAATTDQVRTCTLLGSTPSRETFRSMHPVALSSRQQYSSEHPTKHL